jgi:hypothetical protein
MSAIISEAKKATQMGGLHRKAQNAYWPNVEKLGCEDCIKPLFL